VEKNVYMVKTGEISRFKPHHIFSQFF